jgi:hypothetical protein
MLKSIINAVTSPFRLAREYVDTHPGLDSVRDHFNSVEMEVEESDAGFVINRSIKGCPDIEKEQLAVVPRDPAGNNKFYAQGMVDGWGMARTELTKARRSTIAKQAAAVKASRKRAKAVEKANAEADKRIAEAKQTHDTSESQSDSPIITPEFEVVGLTESKA